MYRTIEGIYDKGRIIPLEEINEKIKNYLINAFETDDAVEIINMVRR